MDLTGGMEAEVDEVAVDPSTPDFMEGVNVWLWDDEGRVALPRVAVDAMGSRWNDAHMISVNLTLPGGRVLVVRGFDTPHSALDAQGRPRVRGAGPLRFECLEPFGHWRLTFDGHAGDTTIDNQIANRFGGPNAIPEPTVPLAFSIDYRPTVAPWRNGSHEPDGTFVPTEQRFEQLASAEGEVQLDGTTIPLNGGGLRIRRKGTMARSDYSDWMGHTWVSAQFPIGRAFGINNYAKHPDGRVRYHEGWVLDAGEILPAKFVEAPWRTDWVPRGEDISFTLRTKRGDVDIAAETHFTTANPLAEHTPEGRTPFPSTQQSIARYRWGDEEAYGMIERSRQLELRPS